MDEHVDFPGGDRGLGPLEGAKIQQRHGSFHSDEQEGQRKMHQVNRGKQLKVSKGLIDR